MQVSVELQEMFSYSNIILIICIILLVLCVVFIIVKVIKHLKSRTKTSPKVTNTSRRPFIPSIKQKYIDKINKLEVKLNNNKVSNRQAYQQLSKIMRIFIYEVTNVKVQKYTLSEIKLLNIPHLYELISEYYEPEFSKNSMGDINLSLKKAREVIVKWN